MPKTVWQAYMKLTVIGTQKLFIYWPVETYGVQECRHALHEDEDDDCGPRPEAKRHEDDNNGQRHDVDGERHLHHHPPQHLRQLCNKIHKYSKTSENGTLL